MKKKRALERLVLQEKGQGLTEYVLILALVVLGMWAAIGTTNLKQAVADLFTTVENTVSQVGASSSSSGGGGSSSGGGGGGGGGGGSSSGGGGGGGGGGGSSGGGGKP